MNQLPPKHISRPTCRRMSEQQARDKLARQLSSGDQDKAERIKTLPLFSVALVGSEALKNLEAA